MNNNSFNVLQDESEEVKPVVKQIVKDTIKNTKPTTLPIKTKPGKAISKNHNAAPIKGEFAEKPEHEKKKAEVKKYIKNDRKVMNPRKTGEMKDHGWGDEVKDQQIVDAEEIPVELTEEQLEAIKEREKEEKYVSLADYMKTKTEKKVEDTRKPNEGQDETKWAKLVALSKPDEDLFAGKPVKERKQKEIKQKVQVAINQTFAAVPRESREPKEYKGKKAFNKDFEKKEKRVNVTDQAAFPTLS